MVSNCKAHRLLKCPVTVAEKDGDIIARIIRNCQVWLSVSIEISNRHGDRGVPDPIIHRRGEG